MLIRVIQVNDSKTHDDIIEATNSQTKVAPSSLWATKTIHRDIETVFTNESLFYDRRKNSYRRKGIPLDRVVGIAELAQIVAAVLLQEPDHARARPARYFQDKLQHDKVFSEKYDIGIYAACARAGKAVSAFLQANEPDRGVRRNILFYVMMVSACLGMKTVKPSPQRLAKVEVKNKITSAILQEAMLMVRTSYEKYGANDRAAKGTDMLNDLKQQIRQKFGRKRK